MPVTGCLLPARFEFSGEFRSTLSQRFIACVSPRAHSNFQGGITDEFG